MPPFVRGDLLLLGTGLALVQTRPLVEMGEKVQGKTAKLQALQKVMAGLQEKGAEGKTEARERACPSRMCGPGGTLPRGTRVCLEEPAAESSNSQGVGPWPYLPAACGVSDVGPRTCPHAMCSWIPCVPLCSQARKHAPELRTLKREVRVLQQNVRDKMEAGGWDTSSDEEFEQSVGAFADSWSAKMGGKSGRSGRYG